MARRPRLVIPGVPVHLRMRGNDRQRIFATEGDRLAFLRWLHESSAQNGLEVHAYVLMTNHVHLLATPLDHISLSRTVQDVTRRYVPYFNARQGRTGGLFEGRFQSSLVQVECYYFACHRYVECNPLRAGMVARPEEHIWSSYRHYALGIGDSLVTPHALMGPGAHAELHVRELAPAELAHIRNCTNQGWALGDDAFCSRVGAELGVRVAPVGKGHGARRDGVQVEERGQTLLLEGV